MNTTKNKRKITIVGSGYVGMSLSVLLAKKNLVTVLDIDAERVQKILSRKSTIEDKDIQDYLDKDNLSINATTDYEAAYSEAEFIVIATPTDYNSDTSSFDTSSIESVIEKAFLESNKALIVIKSTVPVGFTKSMQNKFSTSRIVFSPEFLREGKALHDNLYPSRIIIGSSCDKSYDFVKLLEESAIKKDINILHTSSDEAEAIKLFANSYLAMRVSFFNELDSFCLEKDLSSEQIIKGVSSDNRIGNGYNNPSFGYGGYCLPKDTKQLLSDFSEIPQTIISSIISSNSSRKDFIAKKIIDRKPSKVGFFRLIMKEGSDNFRSSAILGVMQRIQDANIDVVIFEPNIKDRTFENIEVIKDLDTFKSISDVIVCNRLSPSLSDVSEKVFSRDIFNSN